MAKNMLDERELCHQLISEFGEKIVILRHDVDNIYGIYRPGFGAKILKVLNYGSLAILPLIRRLSYLIPFYEEHAWKLPDLKKPLGNGHNFLTIS